MSKLETVLTAVERNSASAFPPLASDRQRLVQDARTELAALRRRAEDAELIVRAKGHSRVQYPDGTWVVNIRISDHVGYIAPVDPSTGLSVLTDEARKALKAMT